MHVFTIWSTWYMNTLTEAIDKILLARLTLQDSDADHLNRLL